MQSSPEITPIDRCLSCGSDELTAVYSFGKTPIADHLLSEEQLPREDYRVPLDMQFCQQCSLLQLGQSLDPVWMFDEFYPYFSSITSSLLEHSRNHTEELISSQSLDSESLVIEIASNDGYLLQYFQKSAIPVLGIDPLPRQANEAQAKGVDTLPAFFSSKLAQSLIKQGRQADVIIANNVLAHVPALNDFVAGIACLLKDSGLACIEVPYVVDMIDKLEFDTIYHQHLCYFSVTALDQLFRRHGLFLNRVRRLSTLGGSLRLYLGKEEKPDSSVSELLAGERKMGVTGLEYYYRFSSRLDDWKREFLTVIAGLKAGEKRIAAYGASAKGTMLLSFTNLDHSIIDYVVDLNPHKQGHYLPGSCLPIRPVEELLHDQPDYVLLLVWNISDEVLEQQSEFRKRGGRFIVPIPEPVIV